MEAFSRGILSSSHRIQWPQKPCLLSGRSCVKSTSSSVGPLPHAFRLQNYISSGEAPREGRCIITTFVLSTASWWATRLQATQVFGMPMDSHVIDTIREDLKTDAFAQAILVQIDPSRASCSQSQRPGTDYRQFKYHEGLLFFNGSCMFLMVLAAFE